MRKVRNIIFISLFIAICFIPLAGAIFGYESESAEKRVRAASPDFIADGKINTEFTQQFDDYFTDNFAFRPELITAYAYVQSATFGESVSDKVIIGKDGWLFFEPTLNDYKGVGVMTDNEIYRVFKTLDIQQRYLASKGISFIFTVAPNKSALYGEFMPNRYKIVDEQNNADKLFAVMDDFRFDYVNLHEVLESEEQLYHKLDTHWNNKGAVLVYDTLLTKVQNLHDGFVFNTYEDVVPASAMSHSGDLSDMLYPVSDIKDAQYDYGIETLYSTARPIKSLEDITINTRCESGKLNLLMFRDSFANALIPIMANEFASVTFSRAVPYNYMNLSETNVVIQQIVERNLPNIIKEAPLMPALQIAMDENLTETDLDIAISIEEETDYWKLVGIAKPDSYDRDSNFDIFVRIGVGEDAVTFVPFPILEQGYFDSVESDANAAFSMIIEKSTMDGQSRIDIIVYDKGEYFVDTVEKQDFISQ